MDTNVETVSPPDAVTLTPDAQFNWDAWMDFKEKWNKYTRALFFTCVGEDIMQVCELLDIATFDDDNSDLSSLMANLDEHFRAQADEVYATYVFNNRNQHANESAAEYAEALREQSERLGLYVTPSMMRDRLISGLRSDKARNRLNSLRPTSIEACIEACRGLETGKRLTERERVQSAEAEEIEEPLPAKRVQTKAIPNYIKTALQGGSKTRGAVGAAAKPRKGHEPSPSSGQLDLTEEEEEDSNSQEDLCPPGGSSQESRSVSMATVAGDELSGGLNCQHQCEICNLDLPSEDMLRRHLRLHVCGAISNKGNPLMPTLQRRIFLNFPELQVTESDLFDRALFRQATCKICGKSFANLPQHLLRCAPGASANGRNIGRFKCKECGKGLTTLFSLKSHMRLHTGEKPFKCRYCEDVFYTFSGRCYHERRHVDNRPHVCQFCGKRFFTSSNLKDHLTRHHGTGEKNNEKTVYCDRCGLGFKNIQPLQRHMKRNHKNYDYQHQWPCHLCGKIYMNQLSMARHEHVCVMKNKKKDTVSSS